MDGVRGIRLCLFSRLTFANTDSPAPYPANRNRIPLIPKHNHRKMPPSSSELP